MRWVVNGVVSLFILGLGLAGASYGANPGDVVINEIYVNTADPYDGSEYIELYNTTPDSIDLTGWVLSGVEYDEECGEHHHQFPSGSGIPGYGYFVVVRDVADGDGFVDRFGMRNMLEKYGLEMYDSGQYYEVDDPGVPNTIVQNPDDYDDQIRFFPGNGDYGYRCPGNIRSYEVLFLFDSPSRTNLIDAIEYRSSACTQDMCPGVNGTDDAYPRYPNEGVALGRDESSTDTDNSAADLHEEAPTPFAQNSLNLPPDVWSLKYSPCVPQATDSIQISCYVTDDDGSVVLVECLYSVEDPPDYLPSSYDTLTMYPASVGDSLYVVNLPPQVDQSHIRFYVRATDNVGATTTHPGDAPEGAYTCFVGICPISAIQAVDVGDDSSYVMGQARNITGIVTAGRGVYKDNLFVVQDGTGPWSGIYVYDPSYSLPAETGDSVTISGKVIEYYGLTELMVFSGCYQEHSSGNPVPEPLLVTTGTLNTSSPSAERYEGVLIRVDSVTVTNDSLGYGEWEINDGSGPCIVDDDAYYFYTPRLNDELESVRGVLYYSYGDYKIEPRGDEDIVGPPAIYTLRYSPHAPGSSDVIDVSCTVIGDNPILSVKLFYSTNGGATFDSTAMTTSDTVYTAQIGPFADNTVVDYYVEVWDNAGYSGRKPPAGTYDFRVGMNTIYEVQYVTGGGDSSTFAGEPVNVSGIVTAATGEYSDFYFYIQNSYSGPDTPAFDGIKVYDRTGTVSVQRGDSVTVSGDVWEYYNETELAMFFPEAITIHSHNNPVPTPYAITPTQVDTEEAWEGVLVSVENVEVVDPDLGFGEWMVATIGTPSDSCRVGDDAYYTYEPVLGEDLGYVHGIVSYSYGRYYLEPRDDDDICAASEAGINEKGEQHGLAMFIRPNPMTNGGLVRFAVPTSGKVELKIYNVQGALVKTLHDGYLEAGSYKVNWNCRNDQGFRVTPGIYFVRLEDRRGAISNKVIIVK